MSPSVSVDFPAPGAPRDADDRGVPGAASREGGEGVTRGVATGFDDREEPGERGAIAVPGRVDERRDGLGHSSMESSTTAVTPGSAVHDDPLDAGLQRLHRDGAGATRPDQAHVDHAVVVEVAELDVTAVALERRADELDGVADALLELCGFEIGVDRHQESFDRVGTRRPTPSSIAVNPDRS